MYDDGFRKMPGAAGPHINGIERPGCHEKTVAPGAAEAEIRTVSGRRIMPIGSPAGVTTCTPGATAAYTLPSGTVIANSIDIVRPSVTRGAQLGKTAHVDAMSIHVGHFDVASGARISDVLRW